MFLWNVTDKMGDEDRPKRYPLETLAKKKKKKKRMSRNSSFV